MLCVTGFEDNLAAWRARTVRAADCMHELRLDALHDAAAQLSDAGALPPRTVVCCRPERQGGQYRGTESSRVSLLVRAAALGAAWIDVEADCEPGLLRLLPAQRTMLSWHDFERGDAATIRTALKRMQGRSPALKLAVTAADTADLTALLDATPDGTAVLLAMGGAGLLSRCRYRAFGSAWSYVAADATQHTAAGQISLAQARAWRIESSQTTPLLALVGGRQVLQVARYGHLQLTAPTA